MKFLTSIISQIADNKKCHFWLFFAVLSALTSLMMLCYFPLDKFYMGYDTTFHLRRLDALMISFQNGTFPIYIDYSAFIDYGYATRWFYPDFILIPFAILGNFTNTLFAYKALIVTATVLCGVFTYKTVNKIYKNNFAAFISGLLYTFCMYRLFDLSYRGTTSEALAFTFVPIVFYGLYEIIKGDYRKWYILTIGFSLLVYSHLLSSVIIFLTMIIGLIICYKSLIGEKKRIYHLLLAGVVAFIITIYHTLPMLEQMLSQEFYLSHITATYETNYYTLSLRWLIWGMFSGVVPSQPAIMPSIGMLLTLSLGLRLFIYDKSAKLRNTDIIALIGVAYILLASKLFSWSAIPLVWFRFIQFPYRLFLPTSFFLAIAGSYYLSLLITTKKRYVASIFIVVTGISLTIVNDSNDFKNSPLLLNFNDHFTDVYNNNLGTLEYLPAKVPSKEYMAERGDKIRTKHSDTGISNKIKKDGATSFNLTIHSTDTLELPLFYYKGYSAKLNNAPIPVSESKHGLVAIPVNEPGHVVVAYTGTFIQKISPCISIISILLLCIYIYRTRKITSKTSN
ncbi:YfhO family protein [Viscerimonas tarda]